MGEPLATGASEVVLRSSALHMGRHCRLEFQRTLRIPDDGREYPLPPGVGAFPIFAVSQFADRVPTTWRERGGVFIAMHQREALWINFSYSDYWHPTAVKVGIGNINAITGETWDEHLHARAGDPAQDYVVVPEQPWLDGINAGSGRIRQFVAIPLGSGHTVEGQITGQESWGGIQLLAVPPTSGRFPEQPPPERDYMRMAAVDAPLAMTAMSEMGIAAGGTMRQKIYPDRHGIATWDQQRAGRVSVHIANVELFVEITGFAPPPTPIDAAAYTAARLPWFDLYDPERETVAASEALNRVKSLGEIDPAPDGTGEVPSITVDPDQVVVITPGEQPERGGRA